MITINENELSEKKKTEIINSLIKMADLPKIILNINPSHKLETLIDLNKDVSKVSILMLLPDEEIKKSKTPIIKQIKNPLRRMREPYKLNSNPTSAKSLNKRGLWAGNISEIIESNEQIWYVSKKDDKEIVPLKINSDHNITGETSIFMNSSTIEGNSSEKLTRTKNHEMINVVEGKIVNFEDIYLENCKNRRWKDGYSALIELKYLYKMMDRKEELKESETRIHEIQKILLAQQLQVTNERSLDELANYLKISTEKLKELIGQIPGEGAKILGNIIEVKKRETFGSYYKDQLDRIERKVMEILELTTFVSKHMEDYNKILDQYDNQLGQLEKLLYNNLGEFDKGKYLWDNYKNSNHPDYKKKKKLIFGLGKVLGITAVKKLLKIN